MCILFCCPAKFVVSLTTLCKSSALSGLRLVILAVIIIKEVHFIQDLQCTGEPETFLRVYVPSLFLPFSTCSLMLEILMEVAIEDHGLEVCSQGRSTLFDCGSKKSVTL